MDHKDTIVEDPYGSVRNAIANFLEDINGAQMRLDQGKFDLAKELTSEAVGDLTARIKGLGGTVQAVTSVQLGIIRVTLHVDSPRGILSGTYTAKRF